LLLVGDQKQLPPTVKALAAERLGLGTSLFVRLMAMGIAPHLLDVQVCAASAAATLACPNHVLIGLRSSRQYRMHPVLAEFSAAAFYGNTLRNGVTAAQRPPVASFPWPDAATPVVFVNCRCAPLLLQLCASKLAGRASRSA